MTRLRRRVQDGSEITIQAIYYVFMLFLFLGLAYDFGNAGYVVAISRSAALAAAQEAGKAIDPGAFAGGQTVALSGDAAGVAEAVVAGMTGGRAEVTSVAVRQVGHRTLIGVTVTARARLPILSSAFGLGDLRIPIQAQAEAAYGISREIQ